jgi:ABC-type Fe3+/spermidine/putrescine transport system ATPase subunit
LRRQMQVELKALQREVGISFVFVTHDQEEAMVMSDRIALLRSGELEQVDSPREIYNRPATSYVAQFIGHTNLLRCEVRDGLARCETLCWPMQHADATPIFSLRPENIRPELADSTQGERVRFRARVRSRIFHGATQLLQLQLDTGLSLTARVPANTDFPETSAFSFRVEDAVLVRDSAERS